MASTKKKPYIKALFWGAVSVCIYAALLKLAAGVIEDPAQHFTIIAMLATLVVVLLARPVKSAIQNTFDRAFYRDRYDYRRALVGVARDLNSDLDLGRLGDHFCPGPQSQPPPWNRFP